jgi:hypothetical protein
MLRAALVLVLLSGPAAAADWTPPPAKDGFSYPECYCTNRGEKVAVGDTACLRIGGRDYLAQCDMSLNNPIWRRLSEGCPPAPGAALPSGLERLQPG